MEASRAKDSTALPNVHLTHPTSLEESTLIHQTYPTWHDSFSLPAYIHESTLLPLAPLSREGGRTPWILTQSNLPPEQGTILSSCETFRKRALTSDSDGIIHEGIVHGVASVFTPEGKRGKGYAGYMMKLVKEKLRSWQCERGDVIGSILYSDIGRAYYTRFGWVPATSNVHIEFSGRYIDENDGVRYLYDADLEELCQEDERRLRRIMATPAPNVKKRVCIIPDMDHFGWHRAKEVFACEHIFGKVAVVRGVLVGSPGSRIWMVWTRRYYSHPREREGGNVLYILRLVIEDDETATRLSADVGEMSTDSVYDMQLAQLKVVLQAAQKEAKKWELDSVQLWDPSPLVKDMIRSMGLDHEEVERETESIACGLWYDKDNTLYDEGGIVWMNNEHYAWC